MLFKRKHSSELSTTAGIDTLPNELLLRVLTHLPTPDLLHLAKLNRRFYHLSAKTLVLRLAARPDALRLRAHFEQESRWKFSVDMQLTAIDETGRFKFAPIQPMAMRLFESKMLRSPTMHKLSIIGTDFDGLSLNVPESLIPKSQTLPLKELGQHRITSTYNRLVANVASTQTALVYNVTKTPEEFTKVRSGERWVTPILFECPMIFLCQARPGITKMMDKLNARPVGRGIDGRHSTQSMKTPMSSARGGVEESMLLPSRPTHAKATEPMVGGLLLAAH
ncbi:hypothetical protein K450DRAFT_232959 [Umbelopsis ramanniana AG]|uniref:F-box domain-containing protein n=1 Tax=Umbelopsis ramanniana AG TaxID=1314678 RepID=A0AAD5HFU0_UMBRA|nr:uncharacterized protein K450DRAFT_232959 [Umbelopsis ramanniana AG]KAI8581414.1 hypothetical protein K450DRAFT_232959 [Umbelopsis ramanniana AG]